VEDRPINDHEYRQFLAEEKLMGSRCTDCETLYVPPRQICPQCRGDALKWAPATGRGKIVAFTSISIGPAFMAEDGYGRQRPYCTAAVELDEGPRVVARLEDVDPSRPDQIIVGTPVIVRFVHRNGTCGPRTCLAFSPVAQS